METKIKSNIASSTNTDKKDNKTDNMRPSIPGKEAKNEATKDQAPAASPQTTPATATTSQASNSPAAGNHVADTAKPAEAQAITSAPQAEPSKKEIKAELRETKTMGLEDTVKLVEQLGKKIAQKNKLFNTVSNLDTFVVTQSDDKDDVSSDSKFPRCELVISDDGGEEFVTKNPFIIARVVDMVKQLCIEKLAEVEATIVIP